VDPVARFVSRTRASVRRAIRRWPEEPSLLARASAALLLVDPRDAYGRAMFERASARVAEVGGAGGRVLRPSDARAGGLEEISGTLALAIAAHQLGDDALAQSLAVGALDRDHVITRVGGEPLFWLLAAASYGVLGAGDVEGLEVVVDGTTARPDMDGGVAIVAIPDARAGHGSGVSVRRTGGAAPIVRAEVVLGRPFRSARGDAVDLELAGDPGSAGGVAALELSVVMRRAVRGGIVLDIQLPPGVEADEALLQRFGEGGLGSAVAREPGFVRATMAAAGEGVTAVVSLPLRWTVSGDLTGLGVVAYPADDPSQMTVLAPRTLTIAPRRELE
jgi:hypothetical protein